MSSLITRFKFKVKFDALFEFDLWVVKTILWPLMEALIFSFLHINVIVHPDSSKVSLQYLRKEFH